MYDAVIIGAGPGGLYTGITLASKGYKPLIIERNRVLRPVCAGGIGFERVNIPIKIPDDIIQNRIKRGILRVDDYDSVIYGNGVIIDRVKFDNYLLETAKSYGVDVIMGKSANTIIPMNTDSSYGVSAIFNHDHVEARFGVYANGVHSYWLQNIWRSNYEYSFAKTYQIFLKSREKFWNDDEIVLDFTPKYVRTGYVWIFPGDNYVKLGLGSLYIEKLNLKTVLYQYMKDHNISGEVLAEMGKPLPSMKPITLHSGNIAAVGDAGGLCDPLDGAGLINALYSGLKCALSIVMYNNFDAYEDWMGDLKNYNRKMYGLRNVLINMDLGTRKMVFSEANGVYATELENRIRRTMIRHPRLIVDYIRDYMKF